MKKSRLFTPENDECVGCGVAVNPAEPHYIVMEDGKARRQCIICWQRERADLERVK